jgi:hypothetical protein
MFRQVAKPNPKKQRVAGSFSMPAPTGGWNGRDSLASMPPNDAVLLENMIPDTDRVRLRKGYRIHTSGPNGAVETLAEWSGPTGANQLFAACASSNSVFNVSSATATSAIAGSGLSNARWQHVMFGTGGLNYLVMCNGEDAVQNYNGTTWTEPVITGSGLTSSKLVHVTENKERLFFTESSSTSVWYLGTNAIAGAASEFDYGPLMSLGGYVQACATWTLDGGNGLDDYFTVMTSRGEVIVYQGTNPAAASTWGLVGVFRIGAPIGRRCFFNIGADLIVMTDDGFVPLSRALLTGRTATYEAISDKIRQPTRELIESHKSKFGWQPILYPKRGLGIFNVPIDEGTDFEGIQLVINTINRSWCQFNDVDALCWSLYGDNLYFGDKNGNVMHFDSTMTDNGANIVGTGKPAFSNMGIPAHLKKFHHARLHIATLRAVTPAVDILVDYEEKVPTAVPTVSASPLWDETFWDVSLWASEEPEVTTQWFAVTGIGFMGTVHMRLEVNAAVVEWIQTDFLFEKGEFI